LFLEAYWRSLVVLFVHIEVLRGGGRV
jgi:hypothetical protein